MKPFPYRTTFLVLITTTAAILNSCIATSVPGTSSDINSEPSELYQTHDSRTILNDLQADSESRQAETLHEILEIVEDGKSYPVLKKEEVLYTPTSNEYDSSAADMTEKNERIKQTEKITKEEPKNRIKRTTDPNQTIKQPISKRMKTGDTILNIHGAVKDSIGDASVSSNAGDSSHIDTVVIHPSQFLKEDYTAQPHEVCTKSNPTGNWGKGGGEGNGLDVQYRLGPSERCCKAHVGSRMANSLCKPAGKTTTPPMPTVNPNEIIVETGKKVILECNLSSNVTISKWTKDGLRTVYTGNRLEIARVSRNDAGVWRCAGRDPVGRYILGEERILRVFEEAGPPYMELDGRRLDAGNTWMPAREGNTLEVLCIVEGGVPPPIVSWRVVGTSPSEDEHLTRYLHILPDNHTFGGVTVSKVRLSVHRLHHNSSLQCAREQRTPQSMQKSRQVAQLKLDVTYPPSFVISRWPGFGVSLRVGSAAALRCDVDANPSTRPQWHSDTGPSPSPTSSPSNHATVRWNSLLPEHSGWYRCIATWSGTQYSSIGYYLNVKPQDDLTTMSGAGGHSDLPSTTEHMTVQAGGNLQLNCPRGSVGCWSRRILSDNGSFDSWNPAGSQNAHGVLGIRNALYQESGEYKCVGATLGDQQRLKELKRVTVHVTGGPTITPLESRPKELWAEVCSGSGVTVRWLTSDSVLSPGSSSNKARSHMRPTTNVNCIRHGLQLLSNSGHEVWLVVKSEIGSAVHVWPSSSTPPPPKALASHAYLHAPLHSNTLIFYCIASIFRVLYSLTILTS